MSLYTNLLVVVMTLFNLESHIQLKRILFGKSWSFYWNCYSPKRESFNI